eukprot:2669031-Amphidinium_carterae.1
MKQKEAQTSGQARQHAMASLFCHLPSPFECCLARRRKMNTVRQGSRIFLAASLVNVELSQKAIMTTEPMLIMEMAWKDRQETMAD